MADNITVRDSNGAVQTIRSKDTGSAIQAYNVVVNDGSNHYQPSMDTVGRAGYVVITDLTNTFPTADANARALFAQLSDGTHGPAALKASGVRAATTDVALVIRPLMGTNGTQDMPTGDAAARTIFVTPNDGTNSVTVKAASTAALTTDTALVVRPMCPTDGTNTTPAMDAIARAGFQELTDGTTGPVFVTPASTAAVAANKALVVAIHPTSLAGTNADGGAAAGAAGAAGAKTLLVGGVFTAWGSLPAGTTTQQVGNQCDPSGTLKVGSAVLGTPIYGSTDSGGAAAANVSLTIPAAKMGFLDGFDIDGLGATAGSAIAVTITGLLGGTLTFRIGVPAGVTVPVTYSKRFNPPLQASATAQAIAVNVPSFGTNNTASSCNAYGHYV